MSTRDGLAAVGSVVFAVGGMWLLLEQMLAYAARHGVTIVSWRGPWPKSGEQQRSINSQVHEAQRRELRRFRRLRPIPMGLTIAGLVVIVVALFV